MNDERGPIALIGIGLLGSALAERLVQAGYTPQGFDVDPARREEALRSGVRVLPSGAAAAAGCGVVLTCLPDGPAVRAALFEEGIAEALAPGAALTDFTTCAPAEA